MKLLLCLSKRCTLFLTVKALCLFNSLIISLVEFEYRKLHFELKICSIVSILSFNPVYNFLCHHQTFQKCVPLFLYFSH